MNRQALWTVLCKFGCPVRFTNWIKCFHEGIKVREQFSGVNPRSLYLASGAKQSCVWAPVSFNLYLTAILIAASSDYNAGECIEYRTDWGPLNIHHFGARTAVCKTMIRRLVYADLCALFAYDEEDWQYTTTAFTRASRKLGLRINMAKTTCLFQPAPRVSNQPDLNIKIVGWMSNVVLTSASSEVML